MNATHSVVRVPAMYIPPLLSGWSKFGVTPGGAGAATKPSLPMRSKIAIVRNARALLAQRKLWRSGLNQLVVDVLVVPVCVLYRVHMIRFLIVDCINEDFKIQM